MLTEGSPRHELTDVALTRLAGTERAANGLSRSDRHRPRRRLRPGVYEFDGHEAILLRAVSVVEAYVDALLLRFLTDSIESPDALLDRLIAEVEVSSSGGWGSRVGAYKRLGGVNLKKVERWRELEAATEARNAIAHGTGVLTARQRRDPKVQTILLRIGIDSSGGEVRVSTAVLRTVLQSCRRFIRSLDAALD